jgi:hypothetical protein
LKKLFYLAANAMAAFMDFAVGTLITVLVAFMLGHPLLWWEPLVGGVLALLPDFDVLIPFVISSVTGRPFKHNHHESFLHWPFMMLPIVLIVGIFISGEYWHTDKFWTLTALLCVLAHYLHDAAGMGEHGPGWFLRRQQKYWSRLGIVEPADPDHEHWIRTNWLQPSKLSLWELSLGAIALGLTFYLLTGFLGLSLLTLTCVWLWTAFFWWSSYRVRRSIVAHKEQ